MPFHNKHQQPRKCKISGTCLNWPSIFVRQQRSVDDNKPRCVLLHLVNKAIAACTSVIWHIRSEIASQTHYKYRHDLFLLYESGVSIMMCQLFSLVVFCDDPQACCFLLQALLEHCSSVLSACIIDHIQIVLLYV
jgi:hypothetical protein